MDFETAFADLPLVAILRGLKPSEAIEIAATLVERGLRAIEVPLNSPEPLASIRSIVAEFGGSIAVGAGTVYTAAEVRSVREVGGSFIVSPHVSPEVIAATRALGMHSCPGAQSITEITNAITAGATVVKVFPAQALSLNTFRSIIEVAPRGTRLMPTGGIDANNMAQYKQAGAAGVGLGSSLYKAGYPASEVGQRAATLVDAWMVSSTTPHESPGA